MFSAPDSWLIQSKSVFTVASVCIFGSGSCNRVHLCEFYNKRGEMRFSMRK